MRGRALDESAVASTSTLPAARLNRVDRSTAAIAARASVARDARPPRPPPRREAGEDRHDEPRVSIQSPPTATITSAWTRSATTSCLARGEARLSASGASTSSGKRPTTSAATAYTRPCMASFRLRRQRERDGCPEGEEPDRDAEPERREGEQDGMRGAWSAGGDGGACG